MVTHPPLPNPLPPPTLNATLTPSLHPHLLLAPTHDLPCPLHLVLHLPDALFPDPDELADLWGPSRADAGRHETPPSANASHDAWAPSPPSWWSLTPRSIDIERPERPALPALSLKAEPVGAARVTLELEFAGRLDVPLHARYLVPDAGHRGLLAAFGGDGYRDVEVFGAGSGGRIEAAWRCPQVREALRTIETDVVARLPVADAGYRLPVEVITAALVWAGWAWVVYAMVRAVSGRKSKTE